MCDCERLERVPLEEDCRLWPRTAVRDRDLVGDLWMFNGATSALDLRPMSCCSWVVDAMLMVECDAPGKSR